MSNGFVGALNAWLENKRRVGKRNIRDLLSSPADFERMMAPRVDEDLTAQFSRPESAMDLIAGPVGGLAGIIKPKGGNWFPKEIEQMLNVLKPKAGAMDRTAKSVLEEMDRTYPADSLAMMSPETRAQVDRAYASLRPKVAVENWIEGPLKNYITRDMATMEDPVRAVAERRSAEIEKSLATAKKQAEKQFAFAEKIKAEGPRPDMPPGTWEEAVARAERNGQRILQDANEAAEIARTGILHRSYDEPFGNTDAMRNRTKAGTPMMGVAQAPVARSWEDMTDNLVTPRVAGAPWRKSPDLTVRDVLATDAGEWANKLPDDAMIYDISRDRVNIPQINEQLGFSHLTDELSNALNPESGLPDVLRLSPEKMQQLSMEKAVQHVGDINRWRAAQKVAANQELANKASILREYPENNPMGLRWVELKAGDVTDDVLNKLTDSERRFYQSYLESGDSPMEALNAAAGDKNPLVEELKNQLKYEGDTMRHCVGGYCPDVLQGRSRIFSLRDAKGQPHVTIETKPPTSELHTKALTAEQLPKEIYEDYKSRNLLNPTIRYNPEDYSPMLGSFAPRIEQIKGKLNRKPAPEYIPYVQDFVRNSPIGKLGEVKDIRNAELYQIKGNIYTKPELYELHKQVERPDWLEINNALQSEIDEGGAWAADNFAEGGHVTQKAMLNRILNVYNSL